MLQPHHRTAAHLRILRAASPLATKRKGGRMPRQLQPDGLRLDYFNAIVPHVRAATGVFHDAQVSILRILGEQRRDRFDDTLEQRRRAKHIIEVSAGRVVDKLDPGKLHQTTEDYGKKTGRFQWVQLDKQVRSALGVSLGAIEKPIRDLVPVFAKANVELIKTVPDRYQERLARDVQDAFEQGTHPETLARRFVELDDMAENDARRIARDQIGSLAAQFNQERQEAIGVTGYTWRGAQDGRERDNHIDLEGQSFTWDDPPEGGGTDEDEAGHPGSGILCRCFAEPNFGDIISEL